MIDDFGTPAPKKPAAKLKTKILTSKSAPAPRSFETPEEVAAHNPTTDQPAVTVTPAVSTPGKTARLAFLRRFKPAWPPNKEQLLLSGVVVVIVAIGVAGFIKLHHGSTVAQTQVPVKAASKLAPKPTTVPSTLSGLPVDPSANLRPVTGIMIENTPDARPQAGLSQAGVVFEAVAEAGITRFLTLYQDQQPTNVGPVRSARPYYIQWDLGFDAPYAHVGGSPDALSDIKAWGVKDLDQFANGGAYHRVSSRAAPHNVYTSLANLSQLETQKGYDNSSFSGFERKAAAPAKQPTVTSIDLDLSGSTYNVHYDYAAATNSYNRSEGGAPQLDANTNQQLSPKVVIAIVVPESRGALDASGAYYSDYNVLGSGQAFVFQDGEEVSGTWSKATATTQLSFTTSSGQVLKLDPGQTWITAITAAGNVSYK